MILRYQQSINISLIHGTVICIHGGLRSLFTVSTLHNSQGSLCSPSPPQHLIKAWTNKCSTPLKGQNEALANAPFVGFLMSEASWPQTASSVWSLRDPGLILSLNVVRPWSRWRSRLFWFLFLQQNICNWSVEIDQCNNYPLKIINLFVVLLFCHL